MEIIMLIWFAGWFLVTLHAVYLNVNYLVAAFTGAFLSWFYWAFWFDSRDLAWMYAMILLTLLLN